MGLLDQAVDNFGNRVIAEEHNTSKIAVADSDVNRALAALSGPRGWDAAEYGISREQAEAMIAAADTPEARTRVMVQLRERALKRAGLDNSNGRVAVVFAGRPGWHRLGTTLRDVFDSKTGIRTAGMDWTVLKRPMAYRGPNDEWLESKDVFSLTRSDTHAKLGTVGSRYQPIQNVEAFNFLDTLLDKFGAKYESCGAVYGGEKVWMLVHLPEQAFKVGSRDEVEPYCLFTNPHDGSGKAYCFPTGERTECANTMRIALRGRKDKGIGIRHTGNIDGKIADARAALGMAVESFSDYKEKSLVMARTKLSDMTFFANDVLDAALDITAQQCRTGAEALAAAINVTEAQRELERKSIQRRMENRESILKDILDRYESRSNGVNGMRGTVWAGLNAISESADHGKLGGNYKGDPEVRASRQMASTIYGEADDAKQIVYEKAVALTA